MSTPSEVEKVAKNITRLLINKFPNPSDRGACVNGAGPGDEKSSFAIVSSGQSSP